MIYGPMLGEVPSMNKLNTSSADIYRLFNGSLNEMPDTDFYAYIDVRDGKFFFSRNLSSLLNDKHRNHLD